VLARKLTVVLFAVILLATVALATISAYQISRNLAHYKLARLTTLTRATRVAVQNMLSTGSLEDLQHMATQLEASREIVGVLIVNTDGEPMIAPSFEPNERLREEMKEEQPVRDLWLAGKDERALIVPLNGKGDVPVGHLAVVQDWTDLIRNRDRSLLRVATFGVSLAGIVAIVLFAAVRVFVAKPLEHVRDVVVAISEGRAGDEEARVMLGQRDEIGELGRAVNLMQDELQNAHLELLDEHSEKLNLERSLVTAQRLAAVGELAAGVAHAIGTALNVVQGRAQLLMERAGPGDDERKDLQVIIDQCGRITQTVRSLLDFSREKEPMFEVLDLNDLVTGVLGLLTTQLQDVEVDVDLQEGGIPVRIDQAMVEEMLVNITLNALQAMTPGGKLTIATESPVASPTTRHKRFAALRVTDTGPGIADEHQTKIFDPFYTTKDVGTGTGLGLSISYKIAAEHGGEIAVENVPEAGARFSIFLPLLSDEDGTPT